MNHNKNYNQNDRSDKRGFGSMDSDKQRDIASKGGRASHRSNSDNRSSDTYDSYDEDSE